MMILFSGIRNVLLIAVIMPLIAQAQNPIIQTKYTADPAPMVYGDTVYLYTGHDEDHALGFEMHDWLLYTSTDMVNWTDHGPVASLKDFKCVPYDNGAWAAQCVHRNGKFYLYCPMPNILKQTMSKHYERRSVCLEKITYNPDGTIQKLPFWSTMGVQQTGTLNPYHRVEAETIAYSEGLKTQRNNGKKISDGITVTSVHNGDYLKVQGVDLSTGASSVDVSVASLHGGKIEIHLDKINGQIVGVVNIATSGEGDVFKTITAPVKKIGGVHDVYFVFKGEKELFNFDWWQLNR